ncbi:MAG TPA: SRPBCC domain-containing protein [Polyangia bacterium]|nr:SRPBCC domain-containing protein [Polyangia bacterium]
MSETATVERTKSIVVEYEIQRPPAAVWRALTEPQLLARWLMENDIRPEVGHRFTFRAPPIPGWDGVVHCEVLEVDPPRRLRYSWRGGSDDLQGYGTRIDTVVTWTLAATPGGGTWLRLEHAGFTDENAFAYEGLAKGWRGKLAARIEAILNAG